MNEQFALRLRQLRKERDLTQEQLSKVSGVSLPTISRYEGGTRDEPKLTIMKQLADYFNVSIDYLAGDSEIRDRNFSSAELLKIFKLLSENDRKMLMDLGKVLLEKEGKSI
jgi:transcriptional regulator with XRE-family HTH domain